MVYLWVAFGGALGALCRFKVSVFSAQRFGDFFPIGTLLVNVLGSLFLGLFLALYLERGAFSSSVYYFFVVGWCGSFTTFSTFSYETFRLLQEGEPQKALWNIVLNSGVCLLSVALAWKGVLLWEMRK